MRTPTVRWCPRREAWISSVGDISEKNGRRLPVAFREGTDGKPILGRKDKARAQRALEAFLAERDARIIRGDAPTLRAVAQLYLDHSERTAAVHTYRGHRQVINLLCKFEHRGQPYSDLLATDFTTAHLERIVKAWVTQGRKPNYVRRLVASTHAMLAWAAQPEVDRHPERLIPSNPISGYRARLDPEEKAERYAGRQEIAAFLRFAWREAATFRPESPMRRFGRLTTQLLRVVARTGCRPGEACAMEWGDIDWKTHVVTFPPSRHKTGKKKREARRIVLPPSIARALRRELERPDHHPRFVFMHKHGARAGRGRDEAGSPWNSNALSRWVKTTRRKAIVAGIKGILDDGDNRFHGYRLRHSHISEFSMKGIDQADNAKLHGTSAKMLDRVYEHKHIEFLKRIREAGDRRD